MSDVEGFGRADLVLPRFDGTNTEAAERRSLTFRSRRLAKGEMNEDLPKEMHIASLHRPLCGIIEEKAGPSEIQGMTDETY